MILKNNWNEAKFYKFRENHNIFMKITFNIRILLDLAGGACWVGLNR